MKKFLALSTKSFEQFGVHTQRELWAKAKAEGYQGLSMECATTFEKAAGSDNRFHAVFSTAAEDRHREIVYQNFDLKNFKKNPVFLDSHNYWGIEYIIGKVHGIKSKDQLEGDIEYALDNPRGMLAYNLTSKGFLNATSIGFIPMEFDEKGNIVKSELLEISAVSVPANPEALLDEKGIKGAETDPETDPEPQPEPTADPEPETDPEPTPAEPEVPAEPEPAQEEVTQDTVAAGVRSFIDHRNSLLKKIASEVQSLAQPGARKRMLMQEIRKALDTKTR